MGLAFFLAVMSLVGTNPSNSNTFANMKDPIIIKNVYNSGYIIKDSIGTIILLDSDKKKYGFLKNFNEGDTIQFVSTLK